MLVKIRNDNPDERYLSKSMIYEVISILLIKKEESNFFDMKYRILNNQGTIALHKATEFEVVESNIPSDYVFIQNGEKNFSLIPQSLASENFWINFFDGEEKAVALFKKRFPSYKDQIF